MKQSVYVLPLTLSRSTYLLYMYILTTFTEVYKGRHKQKKTSPDSFSLASEVVLQTVTMTKLISITTPLMTVQLPNPAVMKRSQHDSRENPRRIVPQKIPPTYIHGRATTNYRQYILSCAFVFLDPKTELCKVI